MEGPAEFPGVPFASLLNKPPGRDAGAEAQRGQVGWRWPLSVGAAGLGFEPAQVGSRAHTGAACHGAASRARFLPGTAWGCVCGGSCPLRASNLGDRGHRDPTSSDGRAGRAQGGGRVVSGCSERLKGPLSLVPRPHLLSISVGSQSGRSCSQVCRKVTQKPLQAWGPPGRPAPRSRGAFGGRHGPKNSTCLCCVLKGTKTTWF